MGRCIIVVVVFAMGAGDNDNDDNDDDSDDDNDDDKRDDTDGLRERGGVRGGLLIRCLIIDDNRTFVLVGDCPKVDDNEENDEDDIVEDGDNGFVILPK